MEAIRVENLVMSVSLIRTIIGLLPATILAFLLYHYDLFAPGPVMVLFFLNPLSMGWWVARALPAALNAAWILAAIAIFGAEFRRARIRGALISIGE